MSMMEQLPGMRNVHRNRDRASILGGSDGLHFLPGLRKEGPDSYAGV